MNISRWIRHLIEHRLPPLITTARERLSSTQAVLRQVGRRSGRAGRRYVMTAAGVTARGLGRTASWAKGGWAAGKSATATIPVLVRQVVFGALLLLGVLVVGLWFAASNSERLPATTPAAAAPSVTSAGNSARPDHPATGSGSPGQALAPAPAPASAASAPAPAAPAAAPQAAGAPQAERIYAVAPGDTLAGIALRHQVPFEQLARRNGISDPNKITAGMQLTVSPRLPGTEVIQPGDALPTLTHRYGMSEEKLTVLNPHLVKPPGLLAGAEVRIVAAMS